MAAGGAPKNLNQTLRNKEIYFLIFLLSFFLHCSMIPTIHALNIGTQTTNRPMSMMKDCSRKCESEFCSEAPFLRYGKYCGLLYSGCPGETPCDDLDACCMKHDKCIQSKHDEYLSAECNQDLLDCMHSFKEQQGQFRTFQGNKCNVEQVVEVVTLVIEAAVLAGKVLHES